MKGKMMARGFSSTSLSHPMFSFAVSAGSTPAGFTRSVLPNGITVITHGTSSPQGHVAVVAQAGTRFESPSELGCAQIVSRCLVKDSAYGTALRFSRDAEALGARIDTNVTRDTIELSGAAPNAKLATVAEMLVKAATAPAFNVPDIQAVYNKYSDNQSGIGLVQETIYETGFGHVGLGNRVLTQADILYSRQPEDPVEFHARFFTTDRLVVSATNIDHQKLCDIVSKAASPALAKTTEGRVPASLYKGGQSLTLVPTEDAAVGLGFYLPGNATAEEQAAASVLALVLGYGSTPRGSSARLHVNLNKKYDWVGAGIANYRQHKDGGLLSLIATSRRDYAGFAAVALAQEAQSLRSTITDEEVQRAVNQLVNARSIEADGPYLAVKNARLHFLGSDAKSALNNVRAVTADQVRAVAQKLLASNPTLSVVGEPVQTLSYDEVKSLIQKA